MAVYLFVECIGPRNSCVKNAVYTDTDAEVNPSSDRIVDLLIGQFHGSIEHKGNFCRTFEDIAGHMTVLSHIIA